MTRWPLLILIVLVFPAISVGAEPDCDSCEAPLPSGCDKVCNSARKEAKVTIYVSTGAISADRQKFLLDRLRKELKFLEIAAFGATTNTLIKRILSEQQARRLEADVVLTPDTSAAALLEQNVLRSYQSPFERDIIDRFRDKEGRWTSPFVAPQGILFNRRIIRPSEVPKTLNDLLDPKWKGKLALASTDGFLPLAISTVLGERANRYIKDLSLQSPRLESSTVVGVAVAEGQQPIAVDYLGVALELIKRGMPIDWTPLQPVMTRTFPMGLCTSAPHPNAAKILYDFLLSVPGQRIFRDAGMIPANLRGVPIEQLREVEPQQYRTIDLQNRELMENALRVWQQTFGK